MDLGPPISYEVLAKGTPVLCCDGHQIGEVVHVLAAEHEDIFDGIVIADHLGARGHRFADADDIGEIHERGVLLKLSRQACARLPEPSANPAVMGEDPGDHAPGVSDKLKRAWDFLSGNY